MFLAYTQEREVRLRPPAVRGRQRATSSLPAADHDVSEAGHTQRQRRALGEGLPH